MRFMLIRHADEATEAGVMPSRELAQAMMDYHEEMGRHLKILGGDGLHPSRRGKRITFTDGKPLVVDGPFTETKELIAGYTLVEARDWDEVMAWALRWPAVLEEANVTLEVRQVFELEDFGDIFTGELREQAERVMNPE
jgi:Uncharacterized protein conserved in bacteria